MLYPMFGDLVSVAHSVTSSVSLRSAQHWARTSLTLSCPSNRRARLADPDRVRPVFAQCGANFHDDAGAGEWALGAKNADNRGQAGEMLPPSSFLSVSYVSWLTRCVQ